MQQRARGRQLVIIGIGVVVLVLGVGFFLSHRGGDSGSSSSPAQASAMQPVVVALQPIPQGTVFKAGQPLSDYFGVKQTPTNLVPFGAYSTVNQIARLAQSGGCSSATAAGCSAQITVTQTIYQNAPVVAGMFSQLGQYRQSAGPAFSVPYGYVALAVNLDPVNAVYGSINPGDDVDIIASYDPDAQKNYPSKMRETQYVLNDVRVLSVNAPPAVGSTTGGSSSTGSSTGSQQTNSVLILLLKYQQALIVQHLKDFNWTISVALRSARETDILHFKTDPVTNNWYFTKGGNTFRVLPGSF